MFYKVVWDEPREANLVLLLENIREFRSRRAIFLEFLFKCCLSIIMVLKVKLNVSGSNALLYWTVKIRSVILGFKLILS